MLHPDDRDRCAAADAEARATLSELYSEYRMIHKDGSVVWVSEHAAVARDDATGVLYWQGVMIDISARKRAGERPGGERAAVPVGVRRSDDRVADAQAADGSVRDANPAAEHALGRRPGTLAGTMLWDDLMPAYGHGRSSRVAATAASSSSRSVAATGRSAGSGSCWCSSATTRAKHTT